MTAKEANSLALPVDIASVGSNKMTEKIQGFNESTKQVEKVLKTAAEMFQSKSYKTAAKYFKKALDSFDKREKRNQKQTVILTKYMLCTCWVEIAEMQGLLDALAILEDLMGHCGWAVPMLFYAAGRACFKLYRFNKADEMVKKGFATFRSNDVKFVEYYIPGSDEIIPESTRVGLMTALSILNEQCSSWRRPDAICCLATCSTIGHNEGEDKNIFFGSPTFAGMVQATCNNPTNHCIMDFHIACWKAKKEMQCSQTKISDKEILHLECFTPNCVGGKGNRCTIKKIEIFDHEVSIKATIESRDDDATRHVKSLQPSKGAIKKQQQQQANPKIPTENRTLVRNPRSYKSNNEIKEVPKVNAHEEEEDFNDEHTSKIDIEKLKKLRMRNFGMNGDKIWRPNLSMYGSEYMMATAGVLPDPDFSDDPTDAAEKSFIFSYFYDLISDNGPMKLEHLEEKWKETQVDVLGKNCESILKRHADIADFLTQSLKFVIVGNYICTADKLPAAHDSAKIDASEILKFFMENDIDQNSTTSSLDDEAVFNDIINQDMNNSTLSHCKDNRIEQDLNFPSEMKMNGMKEHEKACTNRCNEGPSITMEKNDQFLESRIKTNVDACEMSESETVPIANVKERDKQELFKSSSITNDLQPMAIKNVQKRCHSAALSSNNACVKWAKNNAVKIQKESFEDQYFHNEKENPSISKIYGVYSVDNIENELALAYTKSENDKFSRKVKSTNDLVNHVTSLDNICETSINVPDKYPVQINKLLAPSGEDAPEFDVDPKRTIDANGVIHQLTAEMGKINEELVQSRNEIEQLKSALTKCEEIITSSKNQLLKKLLQEQYNHYHRDITAKLDMNRNDHGLIAAIQRILMTTTGRLLPINESDFTNRIAELEKISMNLDMRFSKLNEQLFSNWEKGISEEVDLRCDEIPNSERCDMIDVIRTAFGMFRMHQTKELQNLQTPQRNPLFKYSPYDPHPLIFPPNSPNNNLPINYPCYLPLMNATHPAHLQQPLIGPALLPTPPQFFPIRYEPPPPLPPSSSPSSFLHHAIPKNETSMTFTPAPKANNIHAKPANPNTSVTDNQNASNADAMQIPFSTSNESKGRFSEQTKAPSVLRATPTNDVGKEMGTVLHQLDDLSKKFNVSQTTNAKLTTQSSSSGSLKENNVELVDDNDNDMTMKMNKHSATKPRENENFNDTAMNNGRKENKSNKIAGNSMDRLMRRLRNHYFGVLELDLLKSIYCVRKQHNSTLSKLSMRRIICEIDKFIAASQQKQLCGYTMTGSNSSFVVTPINPCQSDGERKRLNSVSSTSSAASLSKKKITSSVGTKKQWDPVNVPNDTWIKDTEETECVICFETMINADCYTLNCKHSFHKKCISDWHKHQTDSKWVMGSCPLCRLHTQIDDEYPPLPLG